MAITLSIKKLLNYSWMSQASYLARVGRKSETYSAV